MTVGSWSRGLKPVRRRWTDPLSRMDGLAFERLMARYYAIQGYRVEHVGTGGAARRYDGGIDLKLYRDDEIVVVQCKRHTARQIPHNDVHQLLGVMHTERATNAIFVTTGEYSDAALRKFAHIPNFELIDGHEVRRLLGPLLDQIVDAAALPVWTYTRDERPGAPLLREPTGKGAREIAKAGGSGSSPMLRFLSFGFGLLMLGLIWLALQKYLVKTGDIGSQRSTRQTQSRQVQQPGTTTQYVPFEPAAARVVPEPTPERHEPTKEEVRESRRRADDAIRVLEDSTPEI